MELHISNLSQDIPHWSITKTPIGIAYKHVHQHDGMPTLLFLHGGPGDHSGYLMQSFGKEIESLFNVVWMDQRGCGNSPRDLAPMDYSIGEKTKDIENVLREAGVKEVVVVAHSFGTILAGLFASAYPHRVTCMINVCGHGSYIDVQSQLFENLAAIHSKDLVKNKEVADLSISFNDFFKLVRSYRMAREAGLYCKDFKTTKALINKHLRDCVANQNYTESTVNESEESLLFLCNYGSLTTFEIYKALKDIKAPTLCLAGAYDKVVDAKCVKKYADHIPNSEFHEFKNSGHYPFDEEKENFIRVLQTFIFKHATPKNGI